MQKYFAYVIPGNTTGNLPFTFELDETVDLPRLKAAIEDVIEAHPGLKGIIRFDGKQLMLYRDDKRKIDIPIIKVTDEEWPAVKDGLLKAFRFDGKDQLFHIALYETETSQYMLFDVAHIMGDGITMNILLEDVNKRYAGEEIERETYTFYDYIVDDEKRTAAGVRKKNIEYYDNLLKGSRITRSILNRKERMDLSHAEQNVIRKKFDRLVKQKIQYFCRQNGISENVLFLTAFNYCTMLFSNENDIFTNSIHSGRTDGRWRRIAGPLFLTYYCRYQVLPHETTINLLKRTGQQIMDTMQNFISVPREGEMFFQYQGDIININEIGGAPAKPIHLQLDSLPFHMQVMSYEGGWYTELRYWENRFDPAQLEIFLNCYEEVVNAMLEERSARRLKKHISEEYFPKHLGKQDEYSEYFINTAGADLVITHHPHVVQGIRILNNRSVFYSLGNFVFGGHTKVSRGDRGTNSLYSLVVQARMYFTDDGVYTGQQIILYPAYDSGADPKNNYQPVRITVEQAEPVWQAIQYDTEWILPSLQADENGRAFAIMDYLPADSGREEGTEPEAGEPEAAPAQPDRNR